MATKTKTDRSSLRAWLVKTLAATGLFTLGGLAGRTWAIDIDASQPSLDLTAVTWKQLRWTSFHSPSDYFRLELPFDRPVAVKGKIEWTEGGEPRSRDIDTKSDVSSCWVFFHSFSTPGMVWPYWTEADPGDLLTGLGKFADKKVVLKRVHFVASSIGGGEPLTFDWPPH